MKVKVYRRPNISTLLHLAEMQAIYDNIVNEYGLLSRKAAEQRFCIEVQCHFHKVSPAEYRRYILNK